MRQKYRTTEFISVRLMYLGHVLHRLSNYFLMSKICQGVYAKGPPPFSLALVFPFPFSFERPPRRLSEKDTAVTLSRVNRMTAPRGDQCRDAHITITAPTLSPFTYPKDWIH